MSYREPALLFRGLPHSRPPPRTFSEPRTSLPSSPPNPELFRPELPGASPHCHSAADSLAAHKEIDGMSYESRAAASVCDAKLRNLIGLKASPRGSPTRSILGSRAAWDSKMSLRMSFSVLSKLLQ